MRIFFDMDGCLAEWRAAATMENLYEKDYFLSLKPNRNVVEAARILHEQGHEVFILSAVLPDSEYAIPGKSQWIEMFMPFIRNENKIFVPSGKKCDAIPGGVCENDILLDDYSKNLHEWAQAGARGIKLMNGVNGTNGSWDGEKVFMHTDPATIASAIANGLEKEAS